MTNLKDKADNQARADEDRRVRSLRVLVDTATVVLRHRPLSRDEADLVVAEVRKRALSLFPDKGETFDLIYGSRLRRVIEERFGTPRA